MTTVAMTSLHSGGYKIVISDPTVMFHCIIYIMLFIYFFDYIEMVKGVLLVVCAYITSSYDVIRML